MKTKLDFKHTFFCNPTLAVHPFHFSANTAQINRQFKIYLEAILQLKHNMDTNSSQQNPILAPFKMQNGFSVWHVIHRDDISLKKPLTEEQLESIMQQEVPLNISLGYARDRSQLGLWVWQVTRPICEAQAQQHVNSKYWRPQIAYIQLTKSSATSP